MDVLMVNSDGLPVAVEVKLARNSQSRREVVGQLVDYVSILTSFTVDELDISVSGALDKALRSFSSQTDSDDSFERRWQSVGANLRAGLARYVIVVDEVPDELERIVRFLVERSSLDIRLVQIRKYPDNQGEVIYVPVNVVEVSSSERAGIVSNQSDIALDFQAVLDAYQTIAESDFLPIGRAKTYRFVRPSTWQPSAGIHYEFCKTESRGVTIEIHLESDAVRPLAPILKAFIEQNDANFPYKMRWEPTWSSNRGRLMVEFPAGTSPEDIARGMRTLIKLTYAKMTEALSKSLTATTDEKVLEREIS